MSHDNEEMSLLMERCSIPGCDNQAVIQMNDCQHREPQKGPNGKYYQRIKRRGQIKNLCERHIRPPRLYGPNGKLIEEINIPGV